MTRLRFMNALALLFFSRVIGQLAVLLFEPSFLPPMRQWYSGIIPYPILLPLQALILGVQWKIHGDVRNNRGWFTRASDGAARRMRLASYVYFALMAARYGVTMVLFPEWRWFRGAIPVVFHWVLAAYLFLLSGCSTGTRPLDAPRF